MLWFGFYVCFFVIVEAQWESSEYNPAAITPCRTPVQKFGTCIPAQECQPMLDALEQVPNPIPPEIQKYLKAYSCGFYGKRPKVCCPSDSIIFPEEEESGFPDVFSHRNIKLLPGTCMNVDLSDKIVNGQKARLFEFPWMALLSYKTPNGPQFKCGGTVINNKYILTAAHCLANLRTPLIGVRVGEHNIKSRVDCETNKYGEVCAPPYQDLRVERVMFHPQYSPRSFTNDIGLIRVSPINLSLENSKPVCLPLDETRNFDITNKNGVVTGWGVTEKGTPSEILLKVSLPFTPLEQCQQKYEKVAKLDDRQLCAGGKSNKDSCAGDSGGPLHVLKRNKGDVQLVQLGIVSFGPSRCGMVPIPGVYTKVAAFMDWILDNLEP